MQLRLRAVLLLALAGIPLAEARAQEATQTFVLQPGWNSVYLEVQPADNRADSVFGPLPLASVWSRGERTSATDFIQNASEAAFNEAGWQRWFHPSRPEAFLNTLHAVFANRAYLVKSTNTTAVNWSITGRPSLRAAEWAPDAFNLRGLPVDPSASPSFLTFFRYSPAHYDSATSKLEEIYRLNAGGQWTAVLPTDVVRSGEAYWIYTRGASEFFAPLSATLEQGDGLEFGQELTALVLRVKNETAQPMTVFLQEQPGGGAGALAYYDFDPVLGNQWPALPSPLSLTASAQSELRVRLGIQRQLIPEEQYASILQLRNGAGVRVLVPVTAARVVAAAGSNPMAGLWAGTASIDAVSEVHSANPTQPTPTRSEFSCRLLVHVDESGQARLLKQVIQMWRNGTYTNDASGAQVVDRPGEYVLLTDDRLIPFFSGATLRDGQQVGRRISSVGYDFPSSSTNNFLDLSGSFAVGQKLTGTISMPGGAPNNPFKHKFHPDHDDLNARFDGPAVESYATTRQIELSFAASPPGGPAVPDFGYNEMGGSYRETISGLHKNPIHISGTFRLTRMSLVASLNPTP